MNLTGTKVILRPIEEQDREMLQNLIEDPETPKLIGGYSGSISYEHQMNWFRTGSDSAGDLRCIIADKDHPEIGLGIILLSNVDLKHKTGEIHIKLRKNVREKGYGQDAVTVLVRYALDGLCLNQICSHILESNTASKRLFEKCGFQSEESGRSNVCSYVIKKNNAVDCKSYMDD